MSEYRLPVQGDLVKFTGATPDQIRWGSNENPNEVLIEGEVYSFSKVEIHSFHTKVWVNGHGPFNSVSFELVESSDG